MDRLCEGGQQITPSAPSKSHDISLLRAGWLRGPDLSNFTSCYGVSSTFHTEGQYTPAPNTVSCHAGARGTADRQSEGTGIAAGRRGVHRGTRGTGYRDTSQGYNTIPPWQARRPGPCPLSCARPPHPFPLSLDINSTCSLAQRERVGRRLPALREASTSHHHRSGLPPTITTLAPTSPYPYMEPTRPEVTELDLNTGLVSHCPSPLSAPRPPPRP